MYKSIIIFFTSSTYFFLRFVRNLIAQWEMRFFSKQFFDSMSYSFDIQQCTVCRKKISQSFYVTSCVLWESNLYIDYRTIHTAYSRPSSSSLLFFVIVIVVLAAAFMHTHTLTNARSARFGSVDFFLRGRIFHGVVCVCARVACHECMTMIKKQQQHTECVLDRDQSICRGERTMD